MRLFHGLSLLYITIIAGCGAPLRVESAAHQDGVTDEAEPARVLLVVLPLNSANESPLQTQLIEAMRRAGLEPSLAEEERVSFPPERTRELERLEEMAAQHELALELGSAAERRREIVALLEEEGATATHPSRLADALSRLAATEVEAERVAEAIGLWQRALALRSDLALDGTFSPSARSAFTTAREQGATLPPRPSLESLERLCIDHEMAAVLWVAVGVDEGAQTVVRVLHRRGTTEPVEVRHNLGTLEPGVALELSEGLIDRVQRELSALSSLQNDDVAPPPPPPPSPWYRRWWFWFTVGAVVVGGATATALVVGLGERQVDITVDWE